MIRTLSTNDIHLLLPIENSAHIAPWPLDTFTMCFQSGYLAWGEEKDGQLVGFIIISLTPAECHILNLCVTPEHQHQGIGRTLITYALDEARKQKTGMAYLEVRRSNAHAISLYRKVGFQLVGERKDYYPSVAGKEDALVFVLSLDSPSKTW